jgi:hypothetical protein
MAFLLYKYIKKRRAASAQTQGNSEHVLKLDNDHQSPFETTDDSGAPQHNVEGSKTEAEIVTVSKEEKQAARIYRWKLVAGLCLPFSVQALETTIIAGALPFIASDFSKYLPSLLQLASFN